MPTGAALITRLPDPAMAPAIHQALSETEREAIAQVLDNMSGKAIVHPSVPAILRNLLGRTK